MSSRSSTDCAGMSIVAESAPSALSKVTENGSSPAGRTTDPAHLPSTPDPGCCTSAGAERTHPTAVHIPSSLQIAGLASPRRIVRFMAMASSSPPSRQSHGPPQYFAGYPVRWVISPILFGLSFQTRPDALQCLFAEILAAVHGRGGQNPARTVGGRQGLDLEALGILGNVAQAGEMALRELLPVVHARHAPGRGRLLRRESEEGLAPISLESALQGRRSGRRGLVPGGLPAQTSRRRQSYGHAPLPGRMPDARRSPASAPGSTSRTTAGASSTARPAK